MKAIVLAAGKGTRLLKEGDDFPKAMKPLCGRPLLAYVLDSLNFIDSKDISVVVGYRRDRITDYFHGYNFVVQDLQLGTGHAVKVCAPSLADYDGPVLVTLGDMPMVRSETFRNMFDLHSRNGGACTILTVVTDIALPYGRIVRDAEGNFKCVVEQRDCTPEQRLINELNPSIYVFDCKALFAALEMLRSDNAQKEYYLTDVPAIMMAQGLKVTTCTIRDDVQVLGVNDEQDLERCARYIDK